MAAISLRVAGTPTSGTATITTVNPAVGTGAAATDLSVLLLTGKPYNTVPGGTALSTWRQVGTVVANGTTGSSTDAGSVFCAVFVKESAAVGAIGNITFTNGNTVTAVIETYQKDTAADAWDVSVWTSGSDITSGANLSCTGAPWDVAAGDWVVCVAGIPTDADTVTASALSGMAGATIGTQTIRVQQNTSMGNDSHMSVVDAPITAGSSSAAPVYTHTDASSRTGQAFFLRLRAAPAQKASTPLAVTSSVSADGSLAISGTSTALAVTSTCSADGHADVAAETTVLDVTADASSGGSSEASLAATSTFTVTVDAEVRLGLFGAVLLPITATVDGELSLGRALDTDSLVATAAPSSEIQHTGGASGTDELPVRAAPFADSSVTMFSDAAVPMSVTVTAYGYLGFNPAYDGPHFGADTGVPTDTHAGVPYSGRRTVGKPAGAQWLSATPASQTRGD